MKYFRKKEPRAHQNILPHSKMTVVFMPISFNEGMAGSYRLKNLVNVLRLHGILCKNIVLKGEYFQERDNTKVYFPQRYNKSFFRPLLKTLFISKNLIRFKTPGENILFNYGYPHIQNILYIYIAKLIGYKIVFDIVEDNYSLHIFKSFWAKLRVKSSLYFIKRIGLIADGAVVINDSLKKMITNQKIRKTHVIKIPISIDIKEFNKNSHTDNLNIFYAGSFGDKDGLKYLLPAFDRVVTVHKESRLLLSGIGSERDMVKFKKYLNDIKSKTSVDYLGYLKRSKYLEVLFNSAVHCVVRSDSNFANGGFPFKLGEMLASGAPVVVTKVGEVEKYLKHNENAILIQPESIDSIYSSIIQVFNDRTNALKIGKAGRKFAFEKFNLENQSKHIINFFINICTS